MKVRKRKRGKRRRRERMEKKKKKDGGVCVVLVMSCLCQRYSSSSSSSVFFSLASVFTSLTLSLSPLFLCFFRFFPSVYRYRSFHLFHHLQKEDSHRLFSSRHSTRYERKKEWERALYFLSCRSFSMVLRSVSLSLSVCLSTLGNFFLTASCWLDDMSRHRRVFQDFCVSTSLSYLYCTYLHSLFLCLLLKCMYTWLFSFLLLLLPDVHLFFLIISCTWE